MKLSLIPGALALSFLVLGGSYKTAEAAVFFGEDIQHFANPSSENAVTAPPDLSEMVNSFAAEQQFLSNIGDAYTTLNFEPDEGFTQLGKTGNAFDYNLSLPKTNGEMFDLRIYDPNSDDNEKLHTSIDDSAGSDVRGGRYGISDAGATEAERNANQFLNTNAGKDSNLTFNFSDPTSAFGFYGTDFERGGVMGLEFTYTDGRTEYISLGLTDPTDDQFRLRGQNHGVESDYIKRIGNKNYLTIRGTSFFFGLTADSEEDYFTQVRFDVSDTRKGTNDMVAFDRMTFASPMLASEDVPEPSLAIISLGTVLSGCMLKRHKRADKSA